VAKDLSRLPPVTFDHVDVTRILKDITLMRSEMCDYQTKITTEINILKTSASLQNDLIIDVNTTGMTTPRKSSTSAPLAPVPGPPPRVPAPSDEIESLHTPTYRNIVCNGKRAPQAKRAPKSSSLERPAAVTAPYRANNTVMKPPTQSEIITVDGDTSNGEGDTSFQSVRRRKGKKKHVNMRGTLSSNGKIQAAEPHCSIYVSRTRKHITETDIMEHISDIGEQYESVQQLKQYQETTFNSFKVTILASKLDKFLSTDFWPKGIVYRRFRERPARAAAQSTRNG
jgi:hypothetical protein